MKDSQNNIGEFALNSIKMVLLCSTIWFRASQVNDNVNKGFGIGFTSPNKTTDNIFDGVKILAGIHSTYTRFSALHKNISENKDAPLANIINASIGTAFFTMAVKSSINLYERNFAEKDQNVENSK